MLLKPIAARLKRIVFFEHLYEYLHIPLVRGVQPKLDELEFSVLREPEEAFHFIWESGDSELAAIRRYLNEGEAIAILHHDSVVHARSSLRTQGWSSIATRRKLRRLGPGEHLLHYVRTAKFARGRGLQTLLYRCILTSNFEPTADKVLSTVDVRNIASLKGSERSGGIRINEIWSIGFLGGRLGFSLIRSMDDTKVYGTKESASQ